MVAGSGARALRRRVKTAALLEDLVYLESGVYHVTAGPGGSIPFFTSGVPDGYSRSWPHPRERHGGELNLAMRPGNAPASAPFQRVLHGPAVINWRASFVPLMDEVGKDFDWLRLVQVREAPGTEKRSRDLAKQDETDPYLIAKWSDQFVRSVVARGVATDLLRGTMPNFVVSTDRLHSNLIRARVRRGQATPALGHYAISVVEPRELTWAEVDELRGHRGMREYRAVIRDIEGEAREEATSLHQLDQLILRKYGVALARAASKQPTVRARIGIASVGLIVGEALGAATGAPVVGGVAGAVVGEGVAEGKARLDRPRWLAVESILRGRK